LEEIERQGAFVDTESAVLSMAGFEAQDLVLDWTLEMLLASESRIQHVHERCRQLEATIRQLTTTNLDVEGRKSIAEASIHNMNRKMRDKMAELEQMRSDLVISNRSRDKIDQELTAAKEDTRRVTLLLKHSREDVQAEKQQLVV
jgi:septal ring factor EnvC (AmiA/AmiB activator)